MKRVVFPLLLLACAAAANAQTEYGRVISTTPVIQQVGVPRQVCTTQQVQTEGQKSGAGALMGAIAGGAVGNSMGDGNGRVATTMLGMVGGAILGDKIEGGGQPQTKNVQHCTNQTFYENRTVGYNVVYEYAGKQYQVQMPHDPGQYVKLQITPVSAVQPQAPLVVEQPVASRVVTVPSTVVSTVYVSTPVWVPSVSYVARAPHHRHVYPTLAVSVERGHREREVHWY